MDNISKLKFLRDSLHKEDESADNNVSSDSEKKGRLTEKLFNQAKDKVKDKVEMMKDIVGDKCEELKCKAGQIRLDIMESSAGDIPGTQGNSQEAVRAELINHDSCYGFLLDDTFMLAAVYLGAGDSGKTEEVVKKWELALNDEQCPALHNEFLRVKEASLKALGDIDPNLSVLSRWLGFLYHMGMLCYAKPDTRITISTKNRSCFQNGSDFQEDVQCIVVRSPWLIEGKLLRQGILEVADEEG